MIIGKQLDILRDSNGQKYVRFSGEDSCHHLEENFTFEVNGTWLSVLKVDGIYVSWPIDIW